MPLLLSSYLIICARRWALARSLTAIAAIRAGSSSRGARQLHVVLPLPRENVSTVWADCYSVRR